MKIKTILFALLIAPSSAFASEYCFDRYDSEIRAVDVSLSNLLRRQSDLESILVATRSEKDKVSREMGTIVRTDPGLTQPVNRERMSQLSKQFDVLDRRDAESTAESYAIQEQAVTMRGKVPAELAGRLRGCVEAVKPANTMVNTVIQTLAILSTGGASLLLPPKALYVDMGQVLNGYPLGGPQSVVNQTRESILNALGLGRSPVGDVIRDPGRVVRCWFGC